MENGNQKVDNRLENKEAEKSIISCMLQDPDTIVSALESMDGKEFTVSNYKKIYDAISELSKSNNEPNVVTVRDYLISKGEKNNIIDMDYLTDIAIHVIDPLQINTFIDIVKERFIMRSILEGCRTINKLCIDSEKNVDDILSEAQDVFFKLAEKKGQKEYVELSKLFPDVLKSVGEAWKSKDGITGIRTKFDKLDKLTSGLQKSDLIILAARPSVGKTAFALNLANNIYQNGYKVVFFSLEMKNVQLATRILSMESRLSSGKLRSGRINDNDAQNLVNTMHMWEEEKARNNGLFIVDEASHLTIAELISKCRKIKKENGLDIVFIDYLQLMHAAKPTDENKHTKIITNRQEEVAEISRSLKGLAKELDIPIVALAQTRRPSDASDKKDKRPQLEDLKESGAIEQDADIVMFLHRPHKDDPEKGEQEEMQLLIQKHRNGPTGYISFNFIGSIMRFEEYDKSNDYLIAPNTDKKTESNV